MSHLQARANSINASHDAKKYSICAPYNGIKDTFEIFYQDFPIGLAAVVLKDPAEIYDLSQTLLGTDDSGEPQGDPSPTAQTAIKRRNFRLNQAFVKLYSHNTDESIKTLLRNEANRNGRAAWLIMIREARGFACRND